MKPREESEGERSSHDSCARFEEDEPTEPSSFSSFETRLWLVQRDMVRVLKLPAVVPFFKYSNRMGGNV